jgi:RNA polymerase sigma-70 factor, ECF subfamily
MTLSREVQLDRGLVERARDGDREAYELLARSVGRSMFQVAHRILRDLDAAEDAVQRALVGIWRDLPRLQDLDRFEAWTYRLVVRASLEEARQRRRHAHVRELPTEGPSVPDSSGPIAARDALDRAFERLSPDHRAVVVLHHYAGFPLGEIAAILGIPYGTVGSRLHHAMRELRAVLGAQDAEPTTDPLLVTEGRQS